MADPAVKAEYDEVALSYKLRKSLIALRQEAGLTQQELATILHTQKSNISRLEHVNSVASPKLSTIEDYANAVGYKINISFEPILNA